MREPDWKSEDGSVRLFCGDCIGVMAELGEGSVDLVVTSPPYNCGKDYDGYADSLEPTEYFAWIKAVLSATQARLSDGARVALNIPWWIGKKPRRFTIPDFCNAGTDAGLQIIDKILWVKGSENGLRGDLGTGWGTWLSPSGPSVRCASEPILIFANGSRGRGRTSGDGRGACVHGDMSKEEFLAFTTDVWMLQGRSDREHPAVFPLDLPLRLTKLYTWPRETVMDPFMGTGTTGTACVRLGRSFVGIEKEPRYFAIAVHRIQKAISERDNKLIPA